MLLVFTLAIVPLLMVVLRPGEMTAEDFALQGDEQLHELLGVHRIAASGLPQAVGVRQVLSVPRSAGGRRLRRRAGDAPGGRSLLDSRRELVLDDLVEFGLLDIEVVFGPGVLLDDPDDLLFVV